MNTYPRQPLSSGRKSEVLYRFDCNFKLHNFPRIFKSFVQILLNVNLSLIQTVLTFLLYVTNLDDPVDSGNLSVRGYLPLI